MDIEGTFAEAKAAADEGRAKDALGLLAELLRHEVGYEPAHELVFELLHEASQNLELIEFYRDLLKEKLDDPDLTIYLSRAYAQGGKDSLAVLQLQKILKKDPSPKAYAELARTYGRMNKIRMALEAINSAIAADPSYGVAHRERVRLLTASGEKDEAAVHAVDSLSCPEIDPETRAWLETADAFLEAGHNPPDRLLQNGKA